MTETGSWFMNAVFFLYLPWDVISSFEHVLWIIYIGDIYKRNCQRQRHVTVTLGSMTVLALATLGNATVLALATLGNSTVLALATLGNATVFALAILGGATRNRNNPICFTSPKVAKASTMVTVVCRCHQHFRLQMSPM
jgi:hypothetical protein